MKKLLSYTLFIIGLFTCVIISAKADSCTYKEQQALSKEAKNIKVSYEIKEQKLPEGYSYYANGILDANGNDVTDNFSDYFVGNYAVISISNLSEELYLEIEDDIISQMNDNIEYVYYSDSEDGFIQLNVFDLNKYHTYKFKAHAATDNCSTYLNTISVSIPRYNELADLDVCSDISDYKYCQKFITTNMDTKTLMKNINNYKASLKSTDNHKKNKVDIKIYLIIGGAVLLLAICIYLTKKFIDSRRVV